MRSHPHCRGRDEAFRRGESNRYLGPLVGQRRVGEDAREGGRHAVVGARELRRGRVGIARRIARRAALGLGRVGSVGHSGSGDIFLAFSTTNRMTAYWGKEINHLSMLPDLNPLFEATVDATEEAIINALVAGRTMTGADGNTVHALPHDRLQDILRHYNRLQPRHLEQP